MKQIFMFFAMLCFGAAFGQVQKLGELSAGKFLDSAVIMEDDESDVFGYCLLYELDRKSKEIFELEYVILDKNLNKLTSVSLTQAVFKTWMARTRTELTFVKKIGSQLTIGVNDRLVNFGEFDLIRFFNHRFIDLNLDNFTFSKEYKYENFTKKELEYKAGDKMEFNDFWDLQKLIKTKSSYMLAFAAPEYNPKVTAVTGSMMKFYFKRYKSVKRFALLDKDMNIVWSKDINSDKKTACHYDYLDSDGEVLLLKKEELINKEVLEAKSIEVYNIKTGQFLGEMMIESKDNNIDLNSVIISSDKIHLFATTYSKKGKNLGYTHIEFDKQSVKETNRNAFLWKDFTSVIPGITEFGETGKGVWHTVQDFVITPKRNVLVVIEALETKAPWQLGTDPKMQVLLKDMYLLEINSDKNIVFSKKIEKKNSVEVPAGLNWEEMRRYGVFDYIFCQNINKAGDFVLFYRLNDRIGSNKKIAKKPLWTLGIVSCVAGEYGFETLPLYGDNIKIYPGLAKNGYIRLLEVNEKTKQGEMRLEKINY